MRGRTSAGRLERLDAWLVRYAHDLLTSGGDGWIVDVGLGDQPWTTLELLDAVRSVDPAARVLGADIEAWRVRAAEEHARPGLTLRVGGLDPLRPSERARVVRAMNVLREGRPEDVAAGHEALGRALVDGGLVIEGSSTRTGEALSAHVLRRRGDRLVREAMVFATPFTRGFAPKMFLHVLPRDLRRQARGTAVEADLLAWQAAFEQTHGPITDRFRDAAARVPALDVGPEGVATWRAP